MNSYKFTRSVGLSAWALLAVTAVSVRAVTIADLAAVTQSRALVAAARIAPPGREIQHIEGWTVFVSRELLEKESAATKAALELLAAHLQQINRVVPPAPAAFLHTVPLWISPEYSGSPPRAEYHPGADWLRDHGRDPVMAKGVEFTNVRIFAAETKRMPVFVLHELAHAYHDQVLGFQDAAIKTAYERAKAAGHYENVERWNGPERPVTHQRAYAMTNEREYFAETTEAFFGRNDFYPFERAQLKEADPEMDALLQQVWFAP